MILARRNFLMGTVSLSIAYGVIFNLLLSVVGTAVVLLAIFGWCLEPSVADDSDYDPPAGGDSTKELATLG